jgi:hypothetical protein
MSFHPKIKGVVNDMMGAIPYVHGHKKREKVTFCNEIDMFSDKV